MLLSCMDMRLLDEIVEHMDEQSLTNQYDHVILAGAALGAVYPGHPHWAQTFWDHLEFARDTHQINEVHILEHRDCSIYRKLLGTDFAIDPAAEAQKHAEVAYTLRTLIRMRYPSLSVKCFLMDLQGKVAPL
jgi:carbonic anhydrase